MSFRHHAHLSYPPEFFGKVPSEYRQGVMSADFEEELPIAPKRLIVCCDGTWQSSVSGLKSVPSNVTRIARSIAKVGKDKDGKVWQQVVFYDAGIASGDLSTYENLREGTMGIGFVGNVIEAYNWLVLNYNLGDEIFCFGFSRGAYTARAVAGLVTDIGIISPEDLQDFQDLFTLYKQHKDNFHFRKSNAYRDWINGVLSPTAHQDLEKNDGKLVYDKAPHCEAPEESRFVKVVGAFDTVGALGIPDLSWTPWNLKLLEGAVGAKPGFHNVGLSPYIQHAYQALALDEHRGGFVPTLWHYPVEGKQCPPKPPKPANELSMDWQLLFKSKGVTEEQLKAGWDALIDAQTWEQLKDAESELEQVWFPGVHVNIGGGSKDPLKEKKGDLEQIALMTFGWMIDQVKPYLQFESGGIWAFNERWAMIRPIIEELEKGEKDYGTGYFGKTFWSALDKVGLHKADVKKLAEGVIHGWGIGPIIDSYEGFMGTSGGSTDRTPGRYTTDEKKNKLGKTNEKIHPSVKYRMMKDTKYKPTGLTDFDRVETPDGFVWVKGDLRIPEWIIQGEHRFTRQLASHDTKHPEGGASMFIGEIDRLLGKNTFERTTLDIREGKIKPEPAVNTGFHPENSGFH